MLAARLWIFSSGYLPEVPNLTSLMRKDFKAMHDILLDGKFVVGAKSFAAAIDRLVLAGRPAQAWTFFDEMEKEYGLVRDRPSLNFLLLNFVNMGMRVMLRKMVKNIANKFFPDEYVCDVLIMGWCVNGKFEEARKLVGKGNL
ncbi:hypothetical protein Ancab_038769 [Ancistrocladus abbreviatus]